MKRIGLVVLLGFALGAFVFVPVRVQFALPQASAVIEANIDPLDAGLAALEDRARDVRRVIRAYRIAGATIALTSEDKAKYVEVLDARKTALVSAWNDVAAIYVATEPIPEPEGES